MLRKRVNAIVAHSLVGIAVAAAVDEEKAVLRGADVVRDGDAHLMPPHRTRHYAVCWAQSTKFHKELENGATAMYDVLAYTYANPRPQ